MKHLVIILITFLLVNSISSLCNSTSCSNVNCFEDKSNGDKYRVTSIDDGDYNIQAFGTFSVNTCNNITVDGVVQYFALKYGLSKINENPDFTKFGKIGLQVDNICRDLPMTMARGIEIISLHRPNSVCRSDFLLCKHGSITSATEKKAIAVIGTGMSFTTIPLASLMSLYSIPQVSYSASSRLLSKNDLYKSFFRTIPSDRNQVTVMIELFRKFRWNFIIAIGSDDDYGKLGITDLKKDLTHVNDICVAKDEYIPYNSALTEKKINEVIEIIAKEEKAKVVILFLFVRGLGDLILQRAKERNITRVWITSEAWNPSGLSLPIDVANQAHGMLTVSLKGSTLYKFNEYVMEALKKKPECNLWLTLYLRNSYQCDPLRYDDVTQRYIGNNCSVPYEKVAEVFRNHTGRYENVIDAVTAIGHAIGRVANISCPGKDKCTAQLESRSITEQINKVMFTNDQGKEIEFEENGDIKYAEYTIDNLLFENGKYRFVNVGSWSSKKEDGKRLTLDIEKIQWPRWFKQSGYPTSNCSETCKPGEYITARQGCCWACSSCEKNYFTDQPGQSSCKKCPEFYHSNPDKTDCLETKQEYLDITDSAGMIVVIISSLGFIIGVLCTIIIIKYWNFAKIGDNSPHITLMSLALVILMFMYGPLHVFKPTTVVCRLQNSLFFIDLMILSGLLLLRSKFITKVIAQYAEEYFRDNLRLTQMLFMVGIILVEIITVIVWLFYDDLTAVKKEIQGEIQILCEVSFTASRLVATFLPCVLLIIATSCAFRERNLEHIFYEPKFLSFTCIALCIVMLAFLPTFKYVSDEYRSIVMAFTLDVYAFTYTTCMVLPKVYVSVVRSMKGKDVFTLKPATIKRKKSKKEKKVEEERPRAISAGDVTESSVVDSVVAPNGNVNSDLPEKKKGDGDNVDIHFEDDEHTSNDEIKKSINGGGTVTFEQPNDTGAHVNGAIKLEEGADNTVF